MANLQERLDELKKSVEDKEKSDLVNPPPALTYSESKQLTSRYKGFTKECNELSSKIRKLKDDCESPDHTEDLDDVMGTCDDLVKRIDDLLALSKATDTDVKQRRIEDVKADLSSVINDVSAIQTEQELLPEKIISNASKDLLEGSEAVAKELFQRLLNMQASVKTTCVRVDDMHTDKTIPRPARKELKSEAVKVLEIYAKVMGALKNLQDTAKKLHMEKVKDIEKRFDAWREKVNDLDVWLTEKTNKNEDLIIEYGTYAQLKDINTENRHMMREMGEIWKKFELIAEEWNTGLCDDVNEDTYADVLVEIQGKFTRLNGIANKFKSLINDMLSQKKAEDEISAKLESWKSYVDEKEEDIAADNTDKTKTESLIKDIYEKDEGVKEFLKDTSVILRNNKYDEKAVELIEEKLKEFCEQWDRLKAQCNAIETKIRQDEQTLRTQKETERNLTESLRIWKTFLDGCTSKLNAFDLDENSETQAVADAIREVEALIGQINNQNKKFKEYEKNAKTLIDTLQEENASQLISQFQSFFEQWEETKEMGYTILSKLKSLLREHIEGEQKVLQEWKAKNMVTEEWLESVATEIEVYAAPDADFDDYLAKLDELENKVNGEVNLVDGSIELGTDLADGGQLTIDENKELIKNDVDAFQTKKTKIQESLQLAKTNVVELRDLFLLQKQNEDEIASHLAEWQQKLQDNIETLDRIEVDETSNICDTQKTIDILIAHLQDIVSNEDDLKVFEANSLELIETLPTENASSSCMALQQFVESWNDCKNKTLERIAYLNSHMDELQNNEACIVNEWDASAKTTIDWLEYAEPASSSFGTGSVEIVEIMKTSVLKYEELFSKVNDKSESIAEQKENGVGLIERGNVQLSENVTKINDHMAIFDEKLAAISENLLKAKEVIEGHVRGVILKKLDDFGAWFPTIHKRSEEGDGIGPDIDTVNKQIQEMKVIQGQALQMSFDDIMHDDNKLLQFFTEEENNDLEAARDKWSYINNWIETRLEILEKSEQIWDDFKMRNVDLTDYLRDVEMELNDVSAVDLNNSEMVEERAESFQKVTTGMETRKHHVANAVELADQLGELVHTESDSESPLASALQSDVTGILDLWNSRVKRSIELKTILQDSCKKFSVLEKSFIEVQEWLSDVNEILDRFSSDARGENFDELRTSLEEKQKEEEEVRRKLDEVISIDEELEQNGELATQYSLEGSVTELNADFDAVSSELAQFTKFRGKARMLSRRVRGSTLRLFTKSEKTEIAAVGQPTEVEVAS